MKSHNLKSCKMALVLLFAFLALFFPIPVIWAVAIVQALMNVKVVLALRVLKRGKWVKNITLAGS